MARDQISFSPPSRRVKLGEFLLNSGDQPNAADDETSSSSSATATPPRLSNEASPYNGSTLTSSPWSQSSYSSPYIKSPWTKLSPFRPQDHRRSENYALIGSLIREEGHVYSIACSHDFLYTGSDSRSIRVWTKDHLKDTGGFKSGSGLVKAIVVDPKTEKVYTGHQDGKIRVWRVSGSEHRRVGSLPTWREHLKSSVNPRSYVAVRRHRRALPVKHYDAVSCFAVNEEIGVMYSGSWDKTVKVWRMADGRCLESIAAHDDAVNAVAVGFDGLVFTGSADGTVKVWRRELEGNKTRHVYVQTLLDQTCAVTSLAVSSGGAGEGSVLYSGSSDGLVNFWEWRKELSYGGVLRGHKLAALSLAAAGQLVFSGSADNSICVWRREPGGVHVCLAVLTGHAGPVKCLAVEEDDGGDESEDEAGQRWIVYSGSLDNSVRVWRVFDNNARAT